ncbi:MAG: hypothetical protein K8J09_06045 [Planctomycetes bacterium]|nr:hypothetical protein [Planctomycetota bacterium]
MEMFDLHRRGGGVASDAAASRMRGFAWSPSKRRGVGEMFDLRRRGGGAASDAAASRM